VVLLVNEATLLPVLMTAAPAASLASRIAVQVAIVLAAHQAPPAIIVQELPRMRDVHFGTTANRNVVRCPSKRSGLSSADADRRVGNTDFIVHRTHSGSLWVFGATRPSKACSIPGWACSNLGRRPPTARTRSSSRRRPGSHPPLRAPPSATHTPAEL